MTTGLFLWVMKFKFQSYGRGEEKVLSVRMLLSGSSLFGKGLERVSPNPFQIAFAPMAFARLAASFKMAAEELLRQAPNVQSMSSH